MLERGKTVIGASSMGALRASELDRSGMIGVGWVYNYFRRSAVRRDADVALVYSPFDFKPMTVPMVDLEYWMEQALAAGLIMPRESARLLKLARSIFFADRTPDRLMDALRRAVPIDTLDGLLALSGGTIPNVKAIDAAEALRLGASLAERHGKPRGNRIAGAQTGSRRQARTEPAADRIARQGPAGSGIVRPASRRSRSRSGASLDFRPRKSRPSSCSIAKSSRRRSPGCDGAERCPQFCGAR